MNSPAHHSRRQIAGSTASRVIRRYALGFLVVAVVTFIIMQTAPVVQPISPLAIALVVGAVIGSVISGIAQHRPRLARTQQRIMPGAIWIASHVLRAGVVLLGLQISLPQVLALGWGGLAIIAVALSVTFLATIQCARWLRLSPAMGLLVATGTAVCGAAAISAMRSTIDDDDADDAAATALALVTLYGLLAIPLLPFAGQMIGFSDHDTAVWIGASVHEVAQVVTAAQSISPDALSTATVTKLARVALLAPLVAVVGITLARRRRGTQKEILPSGHKRPAIVPLFMLGFCLTVTIRSIGLWPPEWAQTTTLVTQTLFAAAMFALGLRLDIVRLVRTGGRALALGGFATLTVTLTALLGLLI